ncbi:MAG: helix-turn-helix transcriptional regulator [Firmicutes bacterium]|nr:helix-turn-helix transcriptional regulator [Bacillota bacterium]
MDQCVISNFRYWMEKFNLSHGEVAAMIGVSDATLYNRFRDPEQFRVWEIKNFADNLGIAYERMVT